MAATKSAAKIWDGVSQAANGTTTSPAIDLRNFYSMALYIKVTNGATGPTLPAEVQIQVSADGTEWYNNGGALSSTLGNGIITQWGSIQLADAVNYARLVGSGNTGQAVVLKADISYITGV